MKYHPNLENRLAENRVMELELKTTNEKPSSVQEPSTIDVVGMIDS